MPRCHISKTLANLLFCTRNKSSLHSLSHSCHSYRHFLVQSFSCHVSWWPFHSSSYFSSHAELSLSAWGKSGCVTSFPCSASSCPLLPAEWSARLSACQSQLTFLPRLGSGGILFGQTGVVGDFLWTHLVFSHFHTCAWAASYTRTLHLFPSPRGSVTVPSVLLDLLSHHLLLGPFPGH